MLKKKKEKTTLNSWQKPRLLIYFSLSFCFPPQKLIGICDSLLYKFNECKVPKQRIAYQPKYPIEIDEIKWYEN